MSAKNSRGLVKALLNLSMDGNSLTAQNQYPPLVVAALPEYTVRLNNVAVSGQTTAQMLSDESTLDTLDNLNGYKNIIHVWEGSNELFFGADAFTTYTNLVNYCLHRKAAGFTVIIATLSPRIYAGTPITQEADRLTVNANIRSNWRTFADALSDIGGDPIVGNYAYCLNTTYFTDGCHFAPAGNMIIAGVVTKAIRSLV
jgi:hypothetical protein